MVPEAMIDIKDPASALAVEVLDELRVSVLECLLALDAIRQESVIDFEPLAESLVVSARVARQAFVAASLLHQDAALTAPTCQESCTTPDSIIDRHLDAVAHGAAATSPDRSDVDDFEAEIGGLPITDECTASSTHLCSAVAVNDSRTSTPGYRLASDGSALSFEVNRDEYRKEIERVLIGRRQLHKAMRSDTIRSAGRHVVQQWMTRRASSMSDNQ